MERREFLFPDWQPSYFAAICEGPSETLGARVEEAERAILTRLEQLAGGRDREMEQFAIKDALDTLYEIKIKKLDFPEQKPPKPIET